MASIDDSEDSSKPPLRKEWLHKRHFPQQTQAQNSICPFGVAHLQFYGLRGSLSIISFFLLLKYPYHGVRHFVGVCTQRTSELDRTHLTLSVLLQSAEQLLYVLICKFYTRLGSLARRKLASYPPPWDLWVSSRGSDMSSQEIKVYYIWLFPLCAGTWTMVTARLLRSELALAGGRGAALNGGLQLIPGYWAGFLGWGWAPLLPQVWRQGRKDLGVSLSPRCPLWGEFSQFRGTLSGNLCPLKWAFFFLFKGGKWLGSKLLLRIRPTGIIRISSQCPGRGSHYVQQLKKRDATVRCGHWPSRCPFYNHLDILFPVQVLTVKKKMFLMWLDLKYYMTFNSSLPKFPIP